MALVARDVRCGKCNEPVEGVTHGFNGWGYRLEFHPRCCPGGVETKCRWAHPAGWVPEEDWMDVDQGLAELREIMAYALVNDGALSQAQIKRTVELFAAIDLGMTRGGAVPTDWRRDG